MTVHQLHPGATSHDGRPLATLPALPDEDVRSLALGHLRSGRVHIDRLITHPSGKVVQVDAVVHGYRGDHTVTYRVADGYRVAGGYACTCDHGRAGHPCQHVYAVELVAHAVTPASRPSRR